MIRSVSTLNLVLVFILFSCSAIWFCERSFHLNSNQKRDNAVTVDAKIFQFSELSSGHVPEDRVHLFRMLVPILVELFNLQEEIDRVDRVNLEEGLTSCEQRANSLLASLGVEEPDDFFDLVDRANDTNDLRVTTENLIRPDKSYSEFEAFLCRLIELDAN